MARSLSLRPALPLLLAAMLSTMTGCSDDKNPVAPGGGATSVTYAGAFASNAGTGSVQFTIDFTKGTWSQGTVRFPVKGNLILAGQDTIPLDGLYESTTGNLSASDSGHASLGYTFSGSHSVSGTAEIIDGTWTGPTTSGWFGTSRQGTQHTTSAYTGTYTGTSSGNVVLLLADFTVRGRWVPSSGGPGLDLHGTSAGNSAARNVSFSAGRFPALILTASGTLTVSTGDMQGTWTRYFDFAPVGDGNWTASRLP